MFLLHARFPGSYTFVENVAVLHVPTVVFIIFADDVGAALVQDVASAIVAEAETGAAMNDATTATAHTTALPANAHTYVLILVAVQTISRINNMLK